MILDFVDLSSDDDEAVVTELNARRKDHSVHVRAEIIDLTSDEDSLEGEHLAYGQFDAAQGTTCLKQELFADDGQAEVAQGTVTSKKQDLGAGDGQGDAAKCTGTLEMQDLRADNGQSDALQPTATLHMQELRADGQGNAAHCTAYLHIQGLRADDVQGDAAQCAETLQRQEFAAEVGQGDAAQRIATLQPQELRADDVQADASQCAIDQGDADQCAIGQGAIAQCTTILQRQELNADDRQGDAAWFTPTMQRQEHAADDEQGDADLCTATQQRQQPTADDGQDAAVHCITALQRQESTKDDTQCDVAHCTPALQRQESDTVHGKGNATQCATTLHRQEFLEAGDSMQEAVQLRNSAEATTSVSRTQGIGRLTGFLNTSHASTAAPFPRQFWKAGEHVLASQVSINNGQNCLRVHPKFLHSNATSHKWPFGAIAELLDNAIDEVNNGATFVKIDKMKHSPDGEYSLVIEDNGGGMSPKSLRHCLSFGFSQKCMTSSIGQYGNGFKTSTMRLGADAIVFTCTKDNRKLTRSVGLLSYTFLTRCNCNDTFVPAVDYEFDASSSNFKRIMDCGEKHFSSNLSILLRWSPFSTEDELLNQFSAMEHHGTKIIVFNLWLNDALEMELDFTTDKEDIIISGAPEIRGHTMLERNHVANRFRYSLRVYASILYLHVPESFQIILCGRAVEPHYVVNDLIFPECIRYRPQIEVTKEVDVITSIGYLKGAPRLDIYGFNIYHKNRLILPYWRAGSYHQRRRGIAGVLEANFIRPTHDKQDFERTGLFYRLETRLKDMATEYGRYHCHLVGYTPERPPPANYVSTTGENDDDSFAGQATTETCSLQHCFNGYDTRGPLHANAGALMDQMDSGGCPSVSINMGRTLHTLRNAPQQSQTELCKRRKSCPLIFWRAQKRRNTNVYSDQPESDNDNEMAGFRQMLDQNTMLKAECSKLEAAGMELTSKVYTLRKELDVQRQMYQHMRSSLEALRPSTLQRSQSNYNIGFL